MASEQSSSEGKPYPFHTHAQFDEHMDDVPTKEPNRVREFEASITAFLHRRPIQLFDLHQMQPVGRDFLYNYIEKELIERRAAGKFKKFFNHLSDHEIPEIFKYAILSHRWGREEVFITDLLLCMRGDSIKGKVNSRKKLGGFFAAARNAKYRFVWFDSGCLDRRVGLEVDESIRSMFSWYHHADACFVHLGDTTVLTEVHEDRWFSRGWTLLELLAPKKLIFFNKNWQRLSPNHQGVDIERSQYIKEPCKWSDQCLRKEIMEGSGITEDSENNILDYFRPNADHAQEIFKCMSRRHTTRPEDIAYSLISLLDVHMPIAYGEGAEWAFYRLQLACIQDTNSRSIFHWDASNLLPDMMIQEGQKWNTLFARSPSIFGQHFLCKSPIYFKLPGRSSQIDDSFAFVNGGVRIMMLLFNLSPPQIHSNIHCTPGHRDPRVFSADLQLLGTKGSKVGANACIIGVSYGPIPKAQMLRDVVLGIYGWSGNVSYGVFLVKRRAAFSSDGFLLVSDWNSGLSYYERCMTLQVQSLPSAEAFKKSGTQPQWVYIR